MLVNSIYFSCSFSVILMSNYVIFYKNIVFAKKYKVCYTKANILLLFPNK